MVDICYHLEMFLLLLSSFICPSPGMQPSPLSVRCRLPFPAAAHGARSVLGPPGSSWFMQAMVQLDGEEINKIKKKRGGISVPGSGCWEVGDALASSLQSLCFQGCFALEGAGGSHRRSK